MKILDTCFLIHLQRDNSCWDRDFKRNAKSEPQTCKNPATGDVIARMRLFFPLLLLIPCIAFGYGGDAAFEGARVVLETKRLECHTTTEAKGGLIMHTREAMIEGGDSAGSLIPGKPYQSSILTRVTLPADDGDRMPPKKHAGPLSPAEIEALTQWIQAGASWPEGQSLHPMARTALTRWDAPPDPDLVEIEAFPNKIRLESARISTASSSSRA